MPVFFFGNICFIIIGLKKKRLSERKKPILNTRVICYTESVTENNFKCKFCSPCNGKGCVSQLPGMGGANGNTNFMLNCAAWGELRERCSEEIGAFLAQKPALPAPFISLAPMTGAVENIGFQRESDFYGAIVRACVAAGIGVSIGDGCPDEKLLLGIDALRSVERDAPETQESASVFIKPYSNERIFERLEWAAPYVGVAGIDIDSYNILTMRNLVRLEKKSAAQLLEIKRRVRIPFAIKGIFTKDDIELLKEVKPDIAYISNHGGRIDTRTGSTAEFLAEYGSEIRKYCGSLWVDGGIRSAQDVETALALGASVALVGRPFASALCHGGAEEVRLKARELTPAALLSDTKTSY